MRVAFLAACLAAAMGAPSALAQNHDQQRAYCDNANGAYVRDLQIGGCTAVIQSGRETTENLAIAFDNRSAAFAAQGDYARAIADADQAAQLAPQNGDFQNSRCWRRAIAGRDLEVARAACDRALQLAPYQDNLLDSRGLVSLKQQRWQDAWNDYNTALRLAPDTAHYLFGRGVAALQLARNVEGQADISRALQLDGAIAHTYAGYDITLPSDASLGPRTLTRQQAPAASPRAEEAEQAASEAPEERPRSTCRPRLYNRC